MFQVKMLNNKKRTLDKVKKVTKVQTTYSEFLASWKILNEICDIWFVDFHKFSPRFPYIVGGGFSNVGW